MKNPFKKQILICLMALSVMTWADVPAQASASNKEETAEERSAGDDLQPDGSGYIHHPHHGVPHHGHGDHGGHYYHHTSYAYGHHRHPVVWHGYYPIVHLPPRYHFHHEHVSF